MQKNKLANFSHGDPPNFKPPCKNGAVHFKFRFLEGLLKFCTLQRIDSTTEGLCRPSLIAPTRNSDLAQASTVSRLLRWRPRHRGHPGCPKHWSRRNLAVLATLSSIRIPNPHHRGSHHPRRRGSHHPRLRRAQCQGAARQRPSSTGKVWEHGA